MEVLSSSTSNNNNYQVDANGQGSSVHEGEVGKEEFASIKSKFRVEIRNKKTRSLLQQKRMKMSLQGGQMSANSMAANQSFEMYMLDDLSTEFNNAYISMDKVETYISLIHSRCYDPIDAQDSILPRIKNSSLFMQLVQFLASSNSNKINLVYDIIIAVSSCCDCSDVAEAMTEVLIARSRSGEKIDPAANHAWFLTQRNTGNDYYVRSVIEQDIEVHKDIDIKYSAILLLSNLAAEAIPSIINRIMKMPMLFPIIRKTVQMEEYTSSMLEQIVVLISNLARVPQGYDFLDFCEFPNLLTILLPLIIQRGGRPLTTLLTGIKDVLDTGDSDNIHGFVNDFHPLVSELNNMLNCDDGRRFEDDKFIEESLQCVLEILQICCQQYAALTVQIATLGIFDGLSKVIFVGRSQELVILALKVFTTAFNQGHSQILDKVAFDQHFNHQNYFMRKLYQLADQNSHEGVKNAALDCLSAFTGQAHQIHFNEVYEDQLIRVLLSGLKSDSVKQDTLQAIILALANLIFVGNLDHPVESNPYTQVFLENSGGLVLDSIQDKLADKSFYDSERLVNLIANGNTADDYDDEEEEDNVFEEPQ